MRCAVRHSAVPAVDQIVRGVWLKLRNIRAGRRADGLDHANAAQNLSVTPAFVGVVRHGRRLLGRKIFD